MKRGKLIKKITSFHPAAGIEYGLSTYTGGMKDSGYWFEGKLLSMKKKKLKGLLKVLNTLYNLDAKPAEVYTGAVIMLSNGMWFHEEEAKAREAFERGIERFWLNL